MCLSTRLSNCRKMSLRKLMSFLGGMFSTNLLKSQIWTKTMVPFSIHSAKSFCPLLRAEMALFGSIECKKASLLFHSSWIS